MRIAGSAVRFPVRSFSCRRYLTDCVSGQALTNLPASILTRELYTPYRVVTRSCRLPQSKRDSTTKLSSTPDPDRGFGKMAARYSPRDAVAPDTGDAARELDVETSSVEGIEDPDLLDMLRQLQHNHASLAMDKKDIERFV